MRGDYQSTKIDSDWQRGTAYIAETRQHVNLNTVLKNALSCLPEGWNVVVLCYLGNDGYVNELIKDINSPRLSKTLLKSPINSLSDYNELLFSTAFWEQFETENLIGFQTDSLFNKKEKHQLEEIAQYDYCGAPWSDGIMRRWSYIPLIGGNGGICFSKRSARLEALLRSTQAYTVTEPHNQKLNEDIWFSLSFQLLGFRLPNRDVATRFFVETIYNSSPFAVHKPWTNLSKDDYLKLTIEMPELEQIRLGYKGLEPKSSIDVKDDYRRFLLRFARVCLQEENHYQADLALQVCQNRYPKSPVSYNLQSKLAYSLGLYEQALNFANKSLECEPNFQKAIENKAVISTLLDKKNTNKRQTKGQFLLIHSWGSGLGFDLLYLLQQLLLAELTNREPVIYWGHNSLYNDNPESNCFTNYFDSVSSVELNDLESFHANAFPDYWQKRVLSNYVRRSRWRNKLNQQEYNLTGLSYLGRPENLVVSGEFTSVKALMPWITKDSPFYEMAVTDIYRRLMVKYIKPKNHLIARARRFISEQFKGQPFIALHLRGTDKSKEKQTVDLASINQQLIDALLKLDSTLPVFVMTDDVRQIAVIKKQLGDRVYSIDVTRSESDTEGVHHRATDKAKIAEEVLVDLLVAEQSAHFFGCGFSYLACCVVYRRKANSSNTLLPFDRMTRHMDIPIPGKFSIE